uniref:Uncharacterized protein n=1 Tax=Ixodes scapularis TaxID=6945 RepID=A0A4D5RYM4_IXOSC
MPLRTKSGSVPFAKKSFLCRSLMLSFIWTTATKTPTSKMKRSPPTKRQCGGTRRKRPTSARSATRSCTCRCPKYSSTGKAIRWLKQESQAERQPRIQCKKCSVHRAIVTASHLGLENVSKQLYRALGLDKSCI